MPEKYIYPYALREAKDIIAKRIYDSIELSGSIPFHWDAVTPEEAWNQVARPMKWDDYLQNREDLPGGLIEREIALANGKLVAIAFIGLKDLGRPKGFRVGAMGLKGALMTLGTFPNKIRL